MPKTHRNAFLALEHNGFKPMDSRGPIRWYWDQKAGRQVKIKVHSGTKLSRQAGSGYRYGIKYKLLPKLDLVVFWAQGETQMLIVPASVLQSILDRPWGNLMKKNEGNGQWTVNIFFDDDGGKQTLHPTKEESAVSEPGYWIYGPLDREDLTKYAYPVPEQFR